MSVAQDERARLVETMRAVGPDHPTLCGDWTTRDLAAHLVVRERRLDAAQHLECRHHDFVTDAVAWQHGDVEGGIGGHDPNCVCERDLH